MNLERESIIPYYNKKDSLNSPVSHLGFSKESSWFSSAFEKLLLFQTPPSLTLPFVPTLLCLIVGR